MTTIVAALGRIARECGVKAPSSWVTATREDHVEIRDDFFDQTISDILDRVDLPSPIGKQQTLTGTGTTNADGSETFSLNSDFRRIQRGEMSVYDPLQDRPAIPISEDGRWTYILDQGVAGIVKYYRTRGYEGNFTIDLYNAPASGQTITVSYISNLWMATSGGTVGSEFTNETDVLLLPRRVVETGTVWRFRERRGLPYLDRYNEYEALIARLSSDSRNRRVVNMGGIDRDVRWQDLVPSFIPSS